MTEIWQSDEEALIAAVDGAMIGLGGTFVHGSASIYMSEVEFRNQNANKEHLQRLKSELESGQAVVIYLDERAKRFAEEA